MKKILFSLLFLVSAYGENVSWEQYKKNVLQKQADIPGWCIRQKAEALMDFIYETKPSQCIEIGTLAGSTTFPMVHALKFLGSGVLYAIDAWDNEACLEGLEPGDPNLTWWPSLKIDMDQTYQFFLRWLANLELKNICFPLRMRSEQAILFFDDESIDLLYIDGNISESGGMQDVTLYFPKVKTGGFIWLNLADLHTKHEIVAFLLERCKWVKEKSVGVHCILFQKEGN